MTSLPLDVSSLVLQAAIRVNAFDLDEAASKNVELLVVVVKLPDLAPHAGRLAVLHESRRRLEVFEAAWAPRADRWNG